jgi:hypothetical protein
MNNQFNIEGKVISVGGVEAVGKDGSFLKRSIVIQTDEQYPQVFQVEFVQDKTSLLDKYNEGDVVKIQFNLRGREYLGKYYPSLSGWKIEAISFQTQPSTMNQPSTTTPSNQAATSPDDLPF